MRIAYFETEICNYYINQRRKSIFTSAPHQIWTNKKIRQGNGS